MTADDFVNVQLSAAGKAAAGTGKSACVRVHGFDYEYCFVPGQPQRIPAREYKARLEPTSLDGKNPVFEIVAAATKPAAESGS